MSTRDGVARRLALRLAAPAAACALLAGAVRAQDAPEPAGVEEETAGEELGGEVVDRVVAIVGEEIVLQSEVDEELYLASLRGEISLRDPEAVARRRRQVLEQLVESKILLEEARRQGIRIERAEADRALDATIDDVRKRFPGEEAFLAQLREEGITLEQLRTGQRAKIEEQLAVRQLVDRAVRSKVSVDEREIRAYWDEHRAEIPRLPARLELSRILVPLQAPGETDSAAVRRAEIVRGRLDAGEDFATLARVFSEGPGAAQGGDIGWFRPDDLEQAIASALEGLGPGATTGVVVTGRGAQILRVRETDPEKGVRLQQIVFLRDEKALRARARARGESLLARLRAGEDFATLAEAESGDRATASRGGRIGTVPLEALEDVYRSVLERTFPGDITDLVEDEEGFSIFRVDAREGERDATYEDVRDRLADVLRNRKGRELYDALLQSARAKTYVETRLEEQAG